MDEPTFTTSREARDYAVEKLSQANRMRGFSYRTAGESVAGANQERKLRRLSRLALDQAIQLERKGL